MLVIVVVVSSQFHWIPTFFLNFNKSTHKREENWSVAIMVKTIFRSLVLCCHQYESLYGMIRFKSDDIVLGHR